MSRRNGVAAAGERPVPVIGECSHVYVYRKNRRHVFGAMRPSRVCKLCKRTEWLVKTSYFDLWSPMHANSLSAARPKARAVRKPKAERGNPVAAPGATKSVAGSVNNLRRRGAR